MDKVSYFPLFLSRIYTLIISDITKTTCDIHSRTWCGEVCRGMDRVSYFPLFLSWFTTLYT